MACCRAVVVTAALLAVAPLAAHAAGRSELRVHAHTEEGSKSVLGSLQELIEGETERFGRSAAAVSQSLKARNLKGAVHERHSHKKGDLKVHHKARLRALSLEAMTAKAQIKSREQEEQPVLYTPKIGVANVTEPTAVPPPPPSLAPWEMWQPYDTAIGEKIVSSFEEPPTATPIPRQTALDMAFGCPVLLSWPSNVEIQTPTPCSDVTDSGNWSAMSSEGGGAGAVLRWNEVCSFEELKTTPTVVYTMPGNGDLFGISTTRTTLFGTQMEIVDCSQNLLYIIEEKVYHQKGPADKDVCDRYGSCDGKVWLQYFIHDAKGQTVGQTAYLSLFQDSYTITDTAGVEIATVTRADGWSPVDRSCSNSTRRWTIAYSNGAPGVWAAAENRWPIAAMMTMLSMRDIYRLPSGMVTMSQCAIKKSIVYLIIVGIIFTMLFCAMMIFIRFFLDDVRHNCIQMEWKLCPKRMAKPTEYEGN
eukprot:gnl/TRDRNA2_/TRDRNA2_185099_c0_seq1.p1 gnl/TRDRNA2_/TRDRNA2_185099_c0~~gnl/TRDRNA2_/TRDRNA2_185099_c0_seq1.p1  ORF type:complete len:474 (+),score=81.24 gnl/TRDRNA2_/TRDRNA2_185099_c0_seq1:109-1530(+)